MRDVEFQALIEQAQLPTWREPTAEELHQLFWCDPPDPLAMSVTALLPRAAPREHSWVVSQAGNTLLTISMITKEALLTAQRAALEYQQRRAAMHLDLVKHGESRPESAQPVSTRVEPSRPVGYRVQLLSGDAWYDVGGSGYLTGRASAEAWRDKLLRAQGHLVLRIVEPGA